MKKIAIAAILSAFVAAPAVAADMYLGVNAGTNKIENFSGADIGSSTGYGILGGYSFNENVAAELSYNHLGDASVSQGPDNLKGTLMSIAAVGSYPLNNDFSLLGKLGYASSKMEVGSMSGTTTGVIYGLGAQYNVTKTVGVRFNYDKFNVGGGDFNETKSSTLMTIGAVFKL